MEHLNICPLDNLDVLLDFNCGVEKMAGCQFLTVDALATKEYSAVGFYTKCHFASAEPVPVRETLRMYYNLLT